MTLKREVGLAGAILMGLGSIIGTGVFVSIGIAAGITGPAVILAIIFAAFVATCNALSSAQLAASNPVSGGTYEYGYRYLKPWLGFSAGWMFLCAKSASAATAALGFSSYFLYAIGHDVRWAASLAVAIIAAITVVVACGVRRSSQANIIFVTVTIFSLVLFVFSGLSTIALSNLHVQIDPSSLFHATALLFVAYTGYGRIATLGEEVKNPRNTIPRAIVTTLFVSMIIYLSVAVVAVGAVGANQFATMTSGTAAPLEAISRKFSLNIHWIVSIGAMTAMLGVLLNLILGLSRVLLAMGRRNDMPQLLSNVTLSVLVVGATTAAIAVTGNLKATWSFSAFTVLTYYAVTNLAALFQPKEELLYNRWWSRIGLVSCLSLAFAIERQIWIAGLSLLTIGLVWHTIRRMCDSSSSAR